MAGDTSRLEFDPGSFRDPSGRILRCNDRIFRIVSGPHVDDAAKFLDSGFYRARAGSSIVSTERLKDAVIERDIRQWTQSEPDALILEHQPIEPISYPFEWPFSLLKIAAQFHLDMHIDALTKGFDLTDASAFNVQFIGCEPIFIDTLSFRPYQPGGHWTGYKQFCEQFLGPLLLTARRGVPFNDWYKGSLNGLDISHIARLMPRSSLLSPSLLVHILLHSWLINRVQSHDFASAKKPEKARGLTEAGLRGLLVNMRKTIASLRPKGLKNTYWCDYEDQNSYSTEDTANKRRIVEKFVQSNRPGTVIDIGCNSGDFSELCLKSGAAKVIGVDFDQGALEAACSRAVEKKLDFLPLYLDLTNPSSNMGWAGRERKSFSSRVRADMVVALAVFHHLIVGKNILMDDAVDWVISLAPKGLLEFVPRSDPMLQGMLQHREDMFADYTEEEFRRVLCAKANILFEEATSASGRCIFAYER